MRFLGAPGQLGAVWIAQSPAVAGEVTVEQLVSQLAEGQRGIGGSVLDPRLQRAQLPFGQGQQQGALWLQQPGELVNQEGLAGAGETLHSHRLVDATEEFTQQAVLLVAEHQVTGQRRQVHRMQRCGPLAVGVGELEIPLAFGIQQFV
ncbi:hypothetical protein D3C71_1794750 [compost metagenome]